MGFRWRRPRPVPPHKDSEDQQEQKRARLEHVLSMVGKAGSSFQDECKLETNPKVGFCWMRRGGCPLRESQGVDFRGTELRDGQLSLGNGRAQERRAVHEAARAVAKDIALPRAVAPGNRQRRHPHQQTDPKVSGGSPGRILLHPLPSWSPESYPVELIWRGLHEAVSRNHNCKELGDLAQFAEGYLRERGPFSLRLGEVYDHLERSPP